MLSLHVFLSIDNFGLVGLKKIFKEKKNSNVHTHTHTLLTMYIPGTVAIDCGTIAQLL